LLVLVVVN